MKKNDLIAKLNEIEGNPEILLWNGYVGDWQHIDSTVCLVDLVKQTFDEYLLRVKYETYRDNPQGNFEDVVIEGEELKDLRNYYRKGIGWEANRYVTEEHIRDGRYKRKTVYMLQPKKRGVESMDRSGVLEY